MSRSWWKPWTWFRRAAQVAPVVIMASGFSYCMVKLHCKRVPVEHVRLFVNGIEVRP